VQILYILL